MYDVRIWFVMGYFSSEIKRSRIVQNFIKNTVYGEHV